MLQGGVQGKRGYHAIPLAVHENFEGVHATQISPLIRGRQTEKRSALVTEKIQQEGADQKKGDQIWTLVIPSFWSRGFRRLFARVGKNFPASVSRESRRRVNMSLAAEIGHVIGNEKGVENQGQVSGATPSGNAGPGCDFLPKGR